MSLTFTDIFNFIFHIDKFMGQMIVMFGVWTIVILFLVVFCETGLVVTPFLPGDSIIFVTGAFAAEGYFSLPELWIVFCIAAILGWTTNYSIGHYIGPRVFTQHSKYLKHEYLMQAQEFYQKHGFFALYLCRFFPILRTFAPFVAGIGSAKYRKFLIYNVSGALSWVTLFLLGGFFFGKIPWVAANMSVLIYGIIIVSLIPAFYAGLSNWLKSRKTKMMNQSNSKMEDK